MRKKIGSKMVLTPMPVLMIGTYDADGHANVMNAAWGGMYDFNQIMISLSEHKTTDNLKLKKEFTLSFATLDTVEISDYFGLVSGRNVDKIAKTGVHVRKAEMVDAPIIDEYPLTVECRVVSFENGILIGEAVNVTADEKILTDGQIDLEKLKPIAFDSFQNKYRVIGRSVGTAFKDGLRYK